MKKAIAALFLMTVLGIAAAFAYHAYTTPQSPQGIDVHAAGDVAPDMMQDVQTAVQLFEQDAARSGAPLIHHVDVYVAATQDDYISVLTNQFEQSAEDAAKIAEVSGGWTGGRKGLTALNGAAGVMDDTSDRKSTTAHELFHQLQFELSDGNDTDEKALFWMEEGAADYVGARIAEQAKGKTLRKWELNTLYDLRMAESTVKPESLAHCTLQQRMALMDKKYHTYQMADAMVICLMQQQKGKELSSLLQYFRLLKDHPDGEEAFEQAFGLSYGSFLKKFRAWYDGELHRPAELAFRARDGVPAGRAEALHEQALAVQPLLKQSFGQEVHGRYDVVVCANPEDYAAAIQAVCAVPKEKAQELAQDSLWVSNAGTIVLHADELTDRRQQQYAMATLMARLLRVQLAGRPEDHADAALDARFETFLKNYARHL
ncbi:hypothetical protein [uncultured Selenomonas sp.]|uniref:hypothetical protein n=1 Tax=uncultured Selenomonas sp. TaxID=159275 RepID=UPI0025F34E00|nr:hypothetical protein [uncultured Selenomonas sp.]